MAIFGIVTELIEQYNPFLSPPAVSTHSQTNFTYCINDWLLRWIHQTGKHLKFAENVQN